VRLLIWVVCSAGDNDKTHHRAAVPPPSSAPPPAGRPPATPVPAGQGWAADGAAEAARQAHDPYPRRAHRVCRFHVRQRRRESRERRCGQRRCASLTGLLLRSCWCAILKNPSSRGSSSSAQLHAAVAAGDLGLAGMLLLSGTLAVNKRPQRSRGNGGGAGSRSSSGGPGSDCACSKCREPLAYLLRLRRRLVL
jgi:hypothetical protein